MQEEEMKIDGGGGREAKTQQIINVN